MSELSISSKVELPPQAGSLPRVHLFSDREKAAIQASLAAGRPLLVRGEPGVGKSQLAEAVAVDLRLPLLSVVVDSRTEPRDLLYQFDSVRRLGEAQLCAAVNDRAGNGLIEARRKLAARRFIKPGVLWWALDWNGALRQAKVARAPQYQTPPGWSPGQRVVLLVDEIDKAESEVPNGLLEALGAWQFASPCSGQPVKLAGQAPIVIITTNEERSLPDPFLRRCAVLPLELPGRFNETGENHLLRKWLIDRASEHFPGDLTRKDVLEKAAGQLLKDRFEAIRNHWNPKPGQAEFLDLVRALVVLHPREPDLQWKSLESISQYLLQKHMRTGE